jgi:hypothetical protein
MHTARLTARLAALLVALGGAGCGDEADPSDPGPQAEGNAVTAAISGGSAETLKGESKTSAPRQFYASVANGELAVYLASAGGSVIFFTVDMQKHPLPARVPAGGALGDSGYLSVTSAAGVYESNRSGSIVLDQCPDQQGKQLSGSFDKIQLKGVMGGASTLSGTFKVMIVLHDGSHRCAGGEPSTSPPGCSVSGCDGPCCPYQACVAGCHAGCVQSKCAGMDMIGCFNCIRGCPDTCKVSAACRGRLQALDACAQKHSCEPGPAEESSCVGQHCCAEYKASF